MNIRILVAMAIAGIVIGIISIYVYNEKVKAQSPVAISYNPYDTGVYATGIVESYQAHGSNVNIYPEVSGKVLQIFVKEGEVVKKDQPLFAIDGSVQRALVLKDDASIRYAKASLVNVEEQLEKIQHAYKLNPQSISKNTLDNAINAVIMARENVDVAKEQYNSDKALLDKYVIKATTKGKILRIVVSKGSYASPTGVYDTYTQGYLPAVQLGHVSGYLQVRCYVDEILVPRLPKGDHLIATLFIRGLNNYGVPLEFVSIQPFTIPNIELSDERNERVDVRVLPVIFRFKKPQDINVYPGQLVDVYIKGTK